MEKESLLQGKADALLRDLLPKIEKMPAEDDYEREYSEVDLEGCYGKGWSAVLMLKKANHDTENNSIVELSVYHLPFPYKSCVIVAFGKKLKLLEKIRTDEVRRLIVERIESLHNNVDDSERELRRDDD